MYLTEPFTGLHGMQGSRKVKEQLFVEVLRSGQVPQCVVGQVGELEERVVPRDVVEVQIHDFPIQRHGGVHTSLLEEYVRGHHQDFVFQGVPRVAVLKGIQRGVGFVEPTLHVQQVGPREHLHRRGQRVEVEVVGDEQAQVDRVVGNQLRCRGLEGVELALGPIEVAAVVADAGVAEFSLVPQGVVLEVQHDL